MRDRYLKEVRMEIKSKKQGEVVQSRWKYRQLMNFIAPFTGSRSGVTDICGSNDDDQDNQDHESGSMEGEPVSSEAVKTPQSGLKGPGGQNDIKPQMAFVAQLPPGSAETQMTQLGILAKTPSGPQTPALNKTGRKRRLTHEALSVSTAPPTKWPHKDNGSSFTNRPRDEDELFLLSFVPALKRLAPQKRCETKMKIQQIMYEAEFNITQAEEHDKHIDAEAHE